RLAHRRALPLEPRRQHLVAHAALRRPGHLRGPGRALHGLDAQAGRLRVPLRVRSQLWRIALNPKIGGARAVWSWALYDFANSPFTTLVVTFIYATYFAKGIVGDEIRGTELWSHAVSITAIVVALGSPVLGALADRGGYRKLFVGVTMAICV